MPARRTYGTGSITQLPSGRWCGRLNLGTKPDGKRDRPAVYGQTKAEVQRKLAALRRQHESGQRVTPSRETVGDWLTTWLETVQRPRLAHSSYIRQETIVRRHLVPAVGHVRLTALTPATIQAAYAESPLTPASLHLCHRLLRQALELAVQWDKLARNPARAVVLPKIPKRQPRVLDEAAAAQFLQSVQGDRWEALYVVALATGCRIGELLGLQWTAVDIERGLLHVERKLLYAGRRVIEDAPKTAAGHRTIPLLPVALAVLRRHRQAQREARLRAPSWSRPDLVFPSAQGTPQRASEVTAHFLPRALAQAGLPRLTFHALRHSFASLMRKRGVPVEVVSQLMGHSSISVTLQVYRSILPGETRAAVEALGDLFADEKATPMAIQPPADPAELAD